MESFGGSGFTALSSSMKKRRSATSRRPRPVSQIVVEGQDTSSHSSTPTLDDGSELSPDQRLGYNSSLPKESSLNSSAPRTASGANNEDMGTSRKIRKVDGKYRAASGFHENGSLRGGQSGNISDSKRCSEVVLTPANCKSSSEARESFDMHSRYPNGLADGVANGHISGHLAGGCNSLPENKVKEAKFKLRIRQKTNSENENSSSMAKPSQSPGAFRRRHGLMVQDKLDDDFEHTQPEKGVDLHTQPKKGVGLQGVPLEDFSGGALLRRSEGFQSKLLESSSRKQIPSSDPVRKRRVPKRRDLDGALEEGYERDEVQYRKTLNIVKDATELSSELKGGGEDSVKKTNISKVLKRKKMRYDVDEDYGSSCSAKGSRKKPRSGKESNDADHVEKDEYGSDDGVDPTREKQKEESVDTSTNARTEPLTTRQRALQSGKGASTGGSSIEFPNGLPPASSRKQKEKLSEEEQQAKKAEAAQRRRMQAEKAARESEAEAIRKILGQDSNRKKKEEKKRKERDKMAQKKAAESLVLASNSIRWVMGPTGTTVTFGDSVGLPSIFETKTSSYPPPRERCAGPSCTNSYKYRDSKLNLPLCSLQCYKAVRENTEMVSSC